VDPRYAGVKKKVATEKAPPGWEGTVKKMKKHKDIDNPFALTWSMKNKGDQPHESESRSRESARFDDDAPRPIDLKTLYRQPERSQGWKNSGVYSPPILKQQEAVSIIVKEF
jgi:hypothetical protein